MTLKDQKKAKIKNKYQNSLSFTLPTLLMEYKLGDLFLGIAHFQGVRKKCLCGQKNWHSIFCVFRTLNGHKNPKIESEHQKASGAWFK